MTALIPLIISGAIALVMAGVFAVIYKTYPKNIHGIKEWMIALLILSSALPMFILRGKIPDLLSIVVANTLIVLGFYLINYGTRKFHNPDEKVLPWHIGFIISFILITVYFTYIDDNIVTRTANNALYALMILLYQFIYVYRNFQPSPGRTLLISSLLIVILSRVFRIETIFLGIDLPLGLFDGSISQLINFIAPSITIPLSTISFILLASEKLNEHLNFISRHDLLTGCLNKQFGMQEFNKEIARSKRYKSKLSIMIIDLDNFKEINDKHGHLIGDSVLVDFSQKARTCLRTTDIFIRFGGDEFFVILPNTSHHQARLVAERIHEATESNFSPAWTVSIGISEWKGAQDNSDKLFSRADLALYEAKNTGRNSTKIV